MIRWQVYWIIALPEKVYINGAREVTVSYIETRLDRLLNKAILGLHH